MTQVLDSILSFIGGIGKFFGGIGSLFIRNDAQFTQRKIDTLIKTIDDMKKTIESNNLRCASEKDALAIEYDLKIETMTDNMDAIANPKVGAREISG